MQANSLRFIFYALRVCAPYNADNYYNLDNTDKDYNERIRCVLACVLTTRSTCTINKILSNYLDVSDFFFIFAGRKV